MGKAIFILLVFILSNRAALAGDDPCNATVLDPTSTIFHPFDNSGNSDSGVEAPPYGGYIGADFWASFIVPASGILNLIIKKGGMVNPAIAIYSGPCYDLKILYNILDNNCDGSESPSALLNNLNPGEQYFMRVWAENGTSNGTFSIYLSETNQTQPGFILHSDATQIGDCIQLTAAANSQHGCAWFELPIDFTQPFTHTMTANFGTQDAAGADGICLIYQTNGPDYCGVGGGGIGAQGMPNSAIFEFDTWQNGGFNDPAADHTAFNINGNMNHANSINGPVSLPNIEDGADHTITFNWNGVTNYELYFDGNLVLSGSYDFINAIFGGSHTAWWGYTASTGAANNRHVICPNIENTQLGTQEYQEVEICEGEDYNGYTTSGFYIDFVPGNGNCLHQINTLLTVHPLPEPTVTEAYICEGSPYFFEGSYYEYQGVYPIQLQNNFGCDSLVFLDLKVLSGELEIVPDYTEFNCYVNQIELSSMFTSNLAGGNINYFWNGPGGYYYDANYPIFQEGYYTLDISYEYESLTCLFNTEIELTTDAEPPTILGLQDITITCDTSTNVSQLDASASIPYMNVEYQWSVNDSIVGIEAIQPIVGEGTYQLMLTNLSNGCVSVASSEVIFTDDRPKVTLSGDTLNCEKTSVPLVVSTNDQNLSYLWLKDGLPFSSLSSPEVSNGGSYVLIVTNENDCQSTASISIIQDTLHPSLLLPSSFEMLCNENGIQLGGYIVDSTFQVEWTGPDDFVSTTYFPFISNGGFYHIKVQDTTNFCFYIDSTFLINPGKSPEINVVTPLLTCQTLSIEPYVEIDQADCLFNWYNQDSLISSTQNVSITSPGTYYYTAISSTGCSSSDSIIVNQNIAPPDINILSPDSIDCKKKSIQIHAIVQDADSIQWYGPMILSYSNQEPIVSSPGIYYITALNSENGCQKNDSVEIISIEQIPAFTLIPDTLNCNKQYLKLNFNITSPFTSVDWYGPNGFHSNELNPEINMEGNYKIHVEVTGNCNIDSMVVIEQDTMLPQPSYSLEELSCFKNYANITCHFLSPVASWSCVSPGGTIFSDTLFQTSEPGLHLLNITGFNGCIMQDTINVIAHFEKPEAKAFKNGDLSCKNEQVILTSQMDSSIVHYIWLQENVKLSESSSYIVEEEGIYQLAVENKFGCRDSAEITVDAFREKPEIILYHEDISCQSYNALFKVDVLKDGNNSLIWRGPFGFISHSTENSVSVGGQYVVTVENQFGCETTDSLFIAEHVEKPQINVITPDTLYIDPDNIDENILVQIISNPNFHIDWTPNIGLSCYDCENPNITDGYQLSYTIFVENEYGCTDSKSVFIREIEKPVIIKIPNIISADNDGFNDRFTFFGPEDKIQEIELLSILDRWGNLIFSTQHISINQEDQGWDGRMNGSEIVPGVYVYFGYVILNNGEKLNFHGDVTVIR